MKRLLISIIGIVLALSSTWGQINMSVTSKAELIPDDADAASYYRQTDINDNVCAIIKVVPDNSLSGQLIMQTRGGMAPVTPPRGLSNYRKENGEWWFWVSPKVTNILFTCEGYTATDWVGVSLQPGKVYRLKLNVESSVTIIKSFSGAGLSGIKMTISPDNAIVSYGTDRNSIISTVVVTDGYFDAPLEEGDYYFKIESEFYQAHTETIHIGSKMTEVKVSLTPEFSILRLTSKPDNAEVFLDGKSIGRTPIQHSVKIAKGNHSLRFLKQDYYPVEQSVNVKGDGILQIIPEVNLRPQFGLVTLICEDKDASLVVTDPKGKEVYRGKSGDKVQLNSQLTYKLEATKKSHASQSSGIVGRTIEGKDVSVQVGAPVPFYGGLRLSSTPSRAEVYIDDKLVGTTLYADRLLIGDHKVVLRKDGYAPLRFSVTIEQDKTVTLSKELKEGLNLIGDYVDLGLSVHWATCNIGAASPESTGEYFAWGETAPKSSYSWKTYSLCEKGSMYYLTRYNGSHLFGTVDKKINLDQSDDVARRLMGESGRMPTTREWQELKEFCTWTLITNKGVKGYKVVGYNGNSIFLPLAGYRDVSRSVSVQTNGFYWSSSLDTDHPSRAWAMVLEANGMYNESNDRYLGYSIRPVVPNPKYDVKQMEKFERVQSVYGPNDQGIEQEAIPFQLVDTKPSFRGGDANQFSKWVNEHLVYPEIAKDNGVQGKVMLQFTIELDGSVTNVRVLRGVDPSIDAEAVRVVSCSPKWSPGKQRNCAVPVTYTFPVIFQLR